MTKSLRWSEQNHADWKAREAARNRATLVVGECNANDKRRAVDMVRVSIPWPPTVNHSTMPNGKGGRILTAEHRAFRCQVANIVHLQRIERVTGRLRVEILLMPPDKRKFDVDNRVKAVLDALEHAGVIEDDAHVDQLIITRGECFMPGTGAANVIVTTIL